jgi:tetratricopeptide (TPR) repeat protein
MSSPSEEPDEGKIQDQDELVPSGMPLQKDPSGLEEQASSEPSEGPPNKPAMLPRNQLLIVFSVIILAVLASAAGGYAVGNKQGAEQREITLSQVVEEQFNLAVIDLEAGRFEIARQRLDYIRDLDPTYPQLADLLAQALVALNAPTGTPVPLISPTPNLAPVRELFEQAEAALAEEDWRLAIELLLGLRAKDSSYRPIEVDGMIFTALRNRGMQSIANGLMEEGLFDLSLASMFGPLDLYATHSQSLAEQYILANSYYGIDWAISTDLFSSLCAQGATYDACFKYGNSAKFYGDLLYSIEDPCAAQVQYENSLNAWENSELAPTATKAANACLTATAPAPPPPPTEGTPEETRTPGAETSTPTPTLTPTPPDGT